MSNELLFIIQTIVGLLFTLLAFRMGRHWLYGYVGVCIVLANIFVTKQITLFGLAATGGNVVYGAVFLATDLLAEHHGKKAAREAVYIGFLPPFSTRSCRILFSSFHRVPTIGERRRE